MFSCKELGKKGARKIWEEGFCRDPGGLAVGWEWDACLLWKGGAVEEGLSD